MVKVHFEHILFSPNQEGIMDYYEEEPDPSPPPPCPMCKSVMRKAKLNAPGGLGINSDTFIQLD
jgi:hypothetical protein